MKKAIAILGAVMFLASWLGVLGLRQYYTWHRPESPQAELGRIVAVQLNYGKTVYVTPEENRILNLTGEWLIVPLVAIVIYAAFQFRKPKNAA